MKAIEPDEILLDPRGTVRDPVTHVDPWRRLVARLFDYALFCSVLWAFKLGKTFTDLETLIPLEYFFWIPIEAASVALLSTTPGKWLLKTKLSQGKRGRISIQAALKRSFTVWVKGIGLGIAFINVLCMLTAYRTLSRAKITSWDASDQFQITHRPIGRYRLGIIAFLSIGALTLYEVYGRRL